MEKDFTSKDYRNRNRKVVEDAAANLFSSYTPIARRKVQHFEINPAHNTLHLSIFLLVQNDEECPPLYAIIWLAVVHLVFSNVAQED